MNEIIQTAVLVFLCMCIFGAIVVLLAVNDKQHKSDINKFVDEFYAMHKKDVLKILKKRKIKYKKVNINGVDAIYLKKEDVLLVLTDNGNVYKGC